MPRAPGSPSASLIAVAVSTSRYAAGIVPPNPRPPFPALATNVTPAAVAEHTAACQASPLRRPQSPSSEPDALRLMFAVRIPRAAALRATQSIPQRTCESVPVLRALSTLTE